MLTLLLVLAMLQAPDSTKVKAGSCPVCHSIDIDGDNEPYKYWLVKKEGKTETLLLVRICNGCGVVFKSVR